MSQHRRQRLRSSFNDFFHGYVTTALWSSNDDSDEPLDKNYGSSDIAPSTKKKMKLDCAKFYKRCKPQLTSYCEYIDSGMEGAGHDFWLTRNGHGAGFWDRGLGPLGEDLSKVAKKFGGVDLYVGDDGKVHS